MNDGGPAFPVSVGTGPLSANFISSGMSLRDWFAGQALSGYFAYFKLIPDADVLSAKCYQLADAMLVERSKAK